MVDYHFPIPGSIEEDKIILFTRKHWFSFIGQAFLSVLLVLIPIILMVLALHFKHHFTRGLIADFLVLGLSIYYLIIMTYIFTAWLTFYYDIYLVTKDAVIDVTQQGFFGRRISQVSLLRVQDVTSTVQGFFPTLFGYGNVLVESAGEQSQNFLIQSVPKPQEMCAKIMELHDKIIEDQGRQSQITSGEGTLASSSSRIPNPAASKDSETPYQQMLRGQMTSYDSRFQEPEPIKDIPDESKDQNSLPPPIQSVPAEPSSPSPSHNSYEGEIEKDDLDQGGSIDLK